MLEHSAWQEVEADYSPRFTQAELLNDGDIRTIREVLHHIAKSTKQLSNEELLRKTRKAIAEKTGINTDLGDLEFTYGGQGLQCLVPANLCRSIISPCGPKTTSRNKAG